MASSHRSILLGLRPAFVGLFYYLCNMKDLVDDNRTFVVPDSKDSIAPVSPDPSHEEAYDAYRDAMRDNLFPFTD